MKTDNSFDKKIELMGRRLTPGSTLVVRDAAIYVTDTLDLAFASAQAAFEDKATPELALQIFDRINAERLRLGPLDDDQGEEPDDD